VHVTPAGEQPPAAEPRRGPLRALRDRFGHLVHELGKFGVVGGTAFAVDTVIYATLLRAGLETLTAKTLATAVSATLAFLGNRFWTWRHRERSGLAREYLLYFFFNAVGLAITLVALGLSHYGLGAIWPGVFKSDLADLIAGSVAGNAAATLFRFWAYRRFVFLAAGTPAESDPSTPAVPARATDRS
jgi:putative flippase GtrA